MVWSEVVSLTWSNFEAYASQLETWLDMEAAAERERLAARRQVERSQNPERSGETIVDLELVDHRTGLAGRLLLDLAKVDRRPLPMNRLKVGSPVILSDGQDSSDRGISGVISQRRGASKTLQVAVEEWPAAARLRLDLSPDETTRRRQLAALGMARTVRGAKARLRETLLGHQQPRFDAEPEMEFQLALNAPQQAAVRFAMAARDVGVIHGPPGTGKTTTLAELIYQAVSQGQRVLACAPSNTAVDNLLERLAPLLTNVVRVGHPARVFAALRGHTLDELVESDRSTAIVREIWREVDELMRAASKMSRSRDANRRRGEYYAEAGRLRKEARQLERNTVQHILHSADVVCTTTTIDEDLLGGQQFDLAVLDEACQCTEAAIWQAMLRSEKLVLAGDHCQLPPTVVSEAAAKQGFAQSAMERLIEHFGPEIFRRLVVQYRMHETIMEFPSRMFYDSQLVAHGSVASHRLQDLVPESVSAADMPVVEFWDTAGAEWDEEFEPDGMSKRNPREAKWVSQHVMQLVECGIQPQDIAVIAPYAAQVRLIRSLVNLPNLEVDTVDGFQGREKEVVVVSLVRSNAKGEIGFLRDIRRTNVAVTRAKRSLRMIGDSATLSKHPFYRQLIDFFEQQDAYHSVWELGEID